MSTHLIDCLRQRGFIDAVTDDELETLCKKPLSIYAGFDPTADSLHVGNLVGIMALAWCQRFGHTPYVILGGATGRIGDPSGKSVERPLLDTETLLHNVASIRTHFDQILDMSGKRPLPVILNNDQWFSQIHLIDFLREIGKHFRIGTMLAKEMVRTRLESEEGMSFTEFSYQLIQGYDFYYLHTHHDVSVEMGGSDQWGNIVAGIELTRKLTGRTVYGITWPLLTRSDGKKFGKSESGAIWLSSKRCSPYEFYQYMVRIPDSDVIKLMKVLTFMDLAEIAAIEKEMKQPHYEVNRAQKRLAEEVTRIVHGEEGVEKARRVTEAAGPGKRAVLNSEVLSEVAADMPHISLPLEEILGKTYAELAVKTGLLTSKGEAVRLMKNGGAYLNDEKLEDPQFVVRKADLIEGTFLLIGSGKKKKMLIKVKEAS